MAEGDYRTISVFDRNTETGEESWIDVRYRENADGSFSPVMHPDSVSGAGQTDALTDEELRATAVPVSSPALGTLGDAKVVTDDQGSVLAYLRGILTTLISTTPTPTTDAGPAQTVSRGLSGLPFTSSDQHSAVASVSDSPVSGQKLCITDIIISVDTDMSVTFKTETDGTVVAGPYYMAARSTLPLTTRGKFKLPVADRKLQVQTSVAGNITVCMYYYSEA